MAQRRTVAHGWKIRAEFYHEGQFRDKSVAFRAVQNSFREETLFLWLSGLPEAAFEQPENGGKAIQGGEFFAFFAVLVADGCFYDFDVGA